MLVTFSCQMYGDVTFFGGAAVSLLKMMGRSGAVPGAISAEDVPEALKQLTDAVKTLPGDDQASDDQEERPVPLKDRAAPLLELLKAAASANVYVMWE
ncbi:DUF1840 domain-containing protein [Bowmanella yangjiangensis]|uniref:DUF1840 domain-containing protein n=1 Tax=Bowmanella yangjiangensis TaxID=2811230 RepID=A0ABS3CPK7_9ALTE|nr:DUF1840 domain-containing protein [Bowmanella yangjiangensis]MBN7818396.1 DUF1840 domain-containing protein [Bowmanella yangjiangensis]